MMNFRKKLTLRRAKPPRAKRGDAAVAVLNEESLPPATSVEPDHLLETDDEALARLMQEEEFFAAEGVDLPGSSRSVPSPSGTSRALSGGHTVAQNSRNALSSSSNAPDLPLPTSIVSDRGHSGQASILAPPHLANPVNIVQIKQWV